MTGPAASHVSVPDYQPRVVVKFRDGIGLPYDESATNDILRFDRSRDLLAAYIEAYPGIVFEPLVRSKTPAEIRELVSRATYLNASYRPPDFLSYFAVQVTDDRSARMLREALESVSMVTFAYVESPPGEPPAVNPGDDPWSMRQGYLDAAPFGIDARHAWTLAGGDGKGQTLVDVEMGWTLQHEDLAARNINVFSGISKNYFYHGTSVLGIIAAVDNNRGLVGIAPGIQTVHCAGEWRTRKRFNRVEAILDAIAVLAFGDVLLLESQAAKYKGYENIPAEIEPAVFDYVELATLSGIVVVAAAGNGGVDLDTVSTSPNGFVFSPESIDSGAIIVGACTSEERRRTGKSNYGSRVDCFAWGNSVVTSTTDTNGTALSMYTDQASGTSAAAAIVAGAVVLVQGVAQQRRGNRLNPEQVRALLTHSRNTKSQHPGNDRIGVMPNLKWILQAI